MKKTLLPHCEMINQLQVKSIYSHREDVKIVQKLNKNILKQRSRLAYNHISARSIIKKFNSKS